MFVALERERGIIPSHLHGALTSACRGGNIFLLPQKQENRPGFVLMLPQGDSLIAPAPTDNLYHFAVNW